MELLLGLRFSKHDALLCPILTLLSFIPSESIHSSCHGLGPRDNQSYCNEAENTVKVLSVKSMFDGL
jgi:hypothetical protein